MELPAPRLINLIWYHYSEGYDSEAKTKLRDNITRIGADQTHPLFELRLVNGLPSQVRKKTTVSSAVEKKKSTLGNRNTDFVPSWWQGEREAYHNAKVAMKGISTLPKMKEH